MKWQGRKRSSNIEDRRGQRSSGRRTGGARNIPRLRMPRGGGAKGGGIGIVGILIILGIGLLFGVDPMALLSGNAPTNNAPQTTRSSAPSGNSVGNDELAQFVGVVIQETEDLWHDVFAQNDLTYVEPKVILYSGRTSTGGCGTANSSAGPFYCPADQNIYIDLSFYDTLRRRFGAPGDFAQAYVLAHEVGHHVQQLTGVLPEFNAARARLTQEEQNLWSVKVELQADCYAGIWAAYAGQENLLEKGDIEEALNAANAIGDDTLQKQAQGYAVPKTFSHGTSEQRKRWFERGFSTSNVGQCDTFSVARL